MEQKSCQMFEQKRISLSTGVELDVVDMGDKQAPALIFLHGFPESHRTWRYQIPHFAQNYRVIAPDQRGYCGSSKPEGKENYTTNMLTADIIALADALAIETFTIIGHDWGGAVAWAVALTYPKRATKLIIMNAPHPYLFVEKLSNDLEQRAASQYMRDFCDTNNDDFIEQNGLAAFLAKAIKWNKSEALDKQEASLMLQAWAQPKTAISMLNWYRGSMIQAPAMDDADYYPEFLDKPFPKISMPTLVIWAMDDKALVPSLLDGLDDLITDLTLVKVSDCDHFIPWEAPDTVNQAMQVWLSSHA